MTARRRALWSAGDVVLLAALAFTGGTMVLAAAWAASRTDNVGAQVGWANLAVFGLLLAGAGNVLWLLAGRRAVGERGATLLSPLAVAPPRPATPPVPTVLVAGDAMSRFHREDCLLVRGKPGPFTRGRRATHVRAGRVPCTICLPAEELAP